MDSGSVLSCPHPLCPSPEVGRADPQDCPSEATKAGQHGGSYSLLGQVCWKKASWDPAAPDPVLTLLPEG